MRKFCTNSVDSVIQPEKDYITLFDYDETAEKFLHFIFFVKICEKKIPD